MEAELMQEELKQQEQDKAELRDELRFLGHELELAQEKLKKSNENEEILARLFDEGIINEQGKIKGTGFNDD